MSATENVVSVCQHYNITHADSVHVVNYMINADFCAVSSIMKKWRVNPHQQPHDFANVVLYLRDIWEEVHQVRPAPCDSDIFDKLSTY
jgi:hypothetical protein